MTIAERHLHPQRWLFWGILSLNMMFIHIFRAAPAVATVQLMAAFHLTGAQLGAMAGAFFYLYAAAQIPGGAVVDWLGARRVASAGMLLAGAGALFFAAAPNVGALYAGRLASGLGVSVIFVCNLKVAADWFSAREFAALAGLSTALSHVGALVATYPLAWLMERLDWRLTVGLFGLLALGMAAVTWGVVRDRPPAAPTGLSELPGRVARVLANRRTWPPLLVFLGLYTPYLTASGMWGVAYLTQVHGLDRQQAAGRLALLTFPVIAGTAVVGQASARLGGRKALMVLAAAVGTAGWATMGLSAGPHPWLLPLALVAAGLGVSGFVPAFAVAKEVNAPRLTGAAMGVTNIGGFLGASLAQPLLGWILDRHWAGALAGGARVYPAAAYREVIWVSAGIAAVALAAALVSTETHCRNLEADP